MCFDQFHHVIKSVIGIIVESNKIEYIHGIVAERFLSSSICLHTFYSMYVHILFNSEMILEHLKWVSQKAFFIILGAILAIFF